MSEKIEQPLEDQLPARVGGAAHTVEAMEGRQIRSAIIDLARDPGFDVAKLQALTEMQERAEDRQARRAFASAMAQAQAECQAVVRSSEVKLGDNKGGYTYASLEAIDDMIRPIMTRYGFSITYDRAPRPEGGGFVITGTLWHAEGHSIEASFPLPLDSGPGRNNLQAAGSTDSYGRKYILLGFFNIVRKGADDDGVAGGGRPISFDEAAQIKGMVAEAGIYDESDTEEERRLKILAWFDDILGYDLPKGYPSIRTEDGVRVRRALLSLKAKRLTQKAEEVKI